MTRRARVPAFAKINLTLLVLYKRGDSYHELRSVFQTVSLADAVEIEYTPAARTAIQVECSIPIEGNIAETAADLALRAMGRRARVRIRLTKRIPIGGGMGGGSSDAAAVLLALPALARRPLPVDVAGEIARGLGSDVPFFLEGGTALALGRGEEIYPLRPLREPHVLVAAAPIAVPTAEAYAALARGPLAGLTPLDLAAKMGRFQSFVRLLECPDARWKGRCENDFEAAVFARHPALEPVLAALRRRGAQPARMSGSGSALFGVFPAREKMMRAARALSAACPDIRWEPVRFLSRKQYQAAWRRALEHVRPGRAGS